MKKIYLFMAICCLGMYACNDMNDSSLSSADEMFVAEIEELISTQKGEFNDEELYAKLTSSVATVSESIYYSHDGKTSLTTMIDSDAPAVDIYLFFDDNTYWACYDPFFHPSLREEPIDGSIRNSWSYDFESNELTIVCDEKDWKWVSTVEYFDGDKMITRGYFKLFDSGFKEVVNIIKFEEGREEAEKKFEFDLKEYSGYLY